MPNLVNSGPYQREHRLDFCLLTASTKSVATVLLGSDTWIHRLTIFSKAAFENLDLARDWICSHTLSSDEEHSVLVATKSTGSCCPSNRRMTLGEA